MKTPCAARTTIVTATATRLGGSRLSQDAERPATAITRDPARPQATAAIYKRLRHPERSPQRRLAPPAARQHQGDAGPKSDTARDTRGRIRPCTGETPHYYPLAGRSR